MLLSGNTTVRRRIAWSMPVVSVTQAVMLVTVYSAASTGATTALLQAGSFVVASRFPAQYMQVCGKSGAYVLVSCNAKQSI